MRKPWRKKKNKCDTCIDRFRCFTQVENICEQDDHWGSLSVNLENHNIEVSFGDNFGTLKFCYHIERSKRNRVRYWLMSKVFGVKVEWR